MVVLLKSGRVRPDALPGRLGRWFFAGFLPEGWQNPSSEDKDECKTKREEGRGKTTPSRRAGAETGEAERIVVQRFSVLSFVSLDFWRLQSSGDSFTAEGNRGRWVSSVEPAARALRS